MEKWPNFFIVGAPKAGTSYLYENLQKIPSVYMSPIKEPNYFNVKMYPKNLFVPIIREKKQYLNLFNNVTTETAIGEATPYYLMDEMAPNLIKETTPKTKIIIMLRNPIERSFSHYLHHIRAGTEIMSFHDLIQTGINSKFDKDDYARRVILEASLYASPVERYVSNFESEKLMIIIYEEFFNDPKKSFFEVLHFLNIEPKQVNIDFDKRINEFGIAKNKLVQEILTNNLIRELARRLFGVQFASKFANKFFTKTVKKPSIEEEDRKILSKFFFNDIKKLETILHKKLDWVA